MASQQEVCAVCPVNPKKLTEGGGANVCMALGGSRDFGNFAEICMAVKLLRERGVEVQSFGGLLAHIGELSINPRR